MAGTLSPGAGSRGPVAHRLPGGAGLARTLPRLPLKGHSWGGRWLKDSGRRPSRLRQACVPGSAGSGHPR